MRQTIAIIALVAFITMGMAGISGMQHDGGDAMTCAATCLGAMRPVVTSALIAVMVVLFILFETSTIIFDTGFSQRFDTRPRTRFRHRFTRWFSLLEHSPTA